MAARNTDLPLWRDPSAKFAPWIVALMTYLATVAFLIALTISATIDQWDQGFSNKLTIEIPPSVQAFDGANTNIDSIQADKAIQVLRPFVGVKTFRILNRSELIGMVQPWFGENEYLQDLPLSILIDVEVDDHDRFNIPLLQRKIQEAIPNAHVEDHHVWKAGLFNVAYTIKTISALVVLLIFLSAICTIAFTTQTSLIIHKQIIEILHLIGAKNSYIARQFQLHSLRVGLKGGFVGIIFTALTILLFENFLQNVDTTLISRVLSTWDIWAVTILIPVLITVFMAFSARFTVLLMLKQS